MDINTRSILFIGIVFVVAVLIGTSLTGFVSVGSGGDGEWLCFQPDTTNCVSYMSGDQWRNENCGMNSTGDVNCDIIYNGQALEIPLSQLNQLGFFGSDDKVCEEYACAVEVWSRVPRQE